MLPYSRHRGDAVIVLNGRSADPPNAGHMIAEWGKKASSHRYRYLATKEQPRKRLMYRYFGVCRPLGTEASDISRMNISFISTGFLGV